MKNIHVTARFKIQENKLPAFKKLVGECIRSTQEKDTGTLQYDWFINEPLMECVVHEKYADSDAVLEHVGNLGELLGRLLEITDMDLELYGDPSQKLRDATAGFDAKIYSFVQGL